MKGKFRAVFTFRGVRYNPCVYSDLPRWAVIGVRKPYTWNRLGMPGRTEMKGFTHYRMFTSEGRADEIARQWRSETHGGELSNEIGNNEHLRGVHVYEEVAVIPCEIVSREGE